MDEILGYLLDDLPTLKTCSLTCKCLFGATRPFIHRRLVCLGSRPEHPKPKRTLFSRRKRDPGIFKQLTNPDLLGVLHYTRHLTLKPKHIYYSPHFNPGDIQEYLPQLRSITRLQSLTLETFYLSPFIPVFNEYFGSFTNTLQRLDTRDVGCAVPELLYIICQFPLLEDLAIVSPAGELSAHHEHPVPTITRSPLLRGKLVVAQVHSRELFEGLAALPGGLNFRSLELRRCEHPEVIFAKCGHTATSISYSWSRGFPSESSPSILVCIMTQPFWTLANPLDLGQCVALEAFEFNTMLSTVWKVSRWILQTLRTVTSTQFNEFVIWILDVTYPWFLRYPLLSDDSWGTLDVLLSALAERNPDFRVVFRGDFDSFRCSIGGEHDKVGSLVKRHLPLFSSKGLVKFEQVSHVENRFRKSGIL